MLAGEDGYRVLRTDGAVGTAQLAGHFGTVSMWPTWADAARDGRAVFVKPRVV